MATIVQQAYTANHSHWRWFALLSIVLHTPLMLELANVKVEHLGGEAITPIAVNLLTNPQHHQPQIEQRNNHQNPSKNIPEKTTLVKQSRTELSTLLAHNKTAPVKTEAHKNPEKPLADIQKVRRTSAVETQQNKKSKMATASTSSQPLIEQRLLSEIKIEFSRYFKYPPRALRKQLEGKVMLSFILNTTGSIQNIVVTKSSGHGILDRAAMASLIKIKLLNGIPKSGISFELPVIYKIHNS